MFLSKLLLNPRSRSVQRDIGSARQMHRTVLRGFPDDLSQERVLYRLDKLEENNLLSLLVQSHLKPNWSTLEEGYLVEDRVSDNQIVKEWYLEIGVGQRFSFRLCANPTKKLSAGKGNKGKRIGLYDVADQIKWLNRKAEENGFAVESVMPSQQQRADDQKHDLKFFSVQFDGILQVTEPDKFIAAIQNGIGSGKAFGFGLLSVAPVQ